MPESPSQAGSFKGTVYGDIIGAPYMIENTHNRYFELGETRRAFSHGKVRTFFPEVTEVSHGATAVCHWLSTYRDDPTAEDLQRCLRNQFLSHPRGGWTEPTRLFLTSERGLPSETPDWAAVTRAVPIAAFAREDLFGALELAEACVRATCSNPEAIRMAQAVTHAVYMARHGAIGAELFTTMEMQYGLHLTWKDDDLRAELRGEVRRPLEMMGTVVPGAYQYVTPEHPSPPSARVVTEAAVMAVTRSDSWEDAVRRAVAYGGPSNAVAGIAGGISEALYGEVTPSVTGKLFPYIPTDITRQIESVDAARAVSLERSARPYSALTRDAFTIIRTGESLTAVVPEGRNDIRKALGRYPEIAVIGPSEEKAFVSRFKETRSGTFAYGTVPEPLTYYLQDGHILSPREFVAPGMPPLQERRRNAEAFRSLRAFCTGVQKELNAAAQNPGAGQIHYGDAFHLWIGERRVDFFFGDSLAGRLCLDGRGLLKVHLGDYRDLSQDARFENHREQAWASRSVFTIAESSSPMDYLEDIRSSIRSMLLDEGVRDGLEKEGDSRYLGDEERADRSPVSNIDHLEPCEEKGTAPLPPGSSTLGDRPSEGRTQEVRTVYSIGYGTRSQEGFINTLRMVDVDTVIDIRSNPRSRYSPQFDADTIYEALKESGVDYYIAGDRLGERPEDPSLYDSTGRADWTAIRENGDYREGIASIEKLAGEGHIVAIVSNEGDPLYGHRFGTASRSLEEDGLTVKHILSNGEIVPHRVMALRLVEGYEAKGVLRSAFTETFPVQLDEAYSILNSERGFRMKSHRARGLRQR